MNILVAEDDLPTQKLMQALLQRSGFTPTIVSGGREAIELLRATRFDAVILDMMLREVGGRAVVDFLVTQPSPPPVLVCSAVHPRLIGDLDARIVRAYLHKPFDIDQFMTKLHDVVGAPQDQERARVLIVDDDLSFRYVMRAFIERADASEAETGEAALAAMRERKPDVVLLDLNLPGISGEEVLDRIANDPETRDTPVVVVTSRPLDDQEREALLGKAAGIINKRDLSRATINTAIDAARGKGQQ